MNHIQNDPRRSLSIKGLMPGLTERGKIKIGQKGSAVTSRNGNAFQPPQKLDHFVVTTLQRGQDGNFLRDDDVHRIIGDRPVEIPVRLLYDDPELNFQSRYVLFSGRTMACSGDGESALRVRQGGGAERDLVQCPCHLADPANTGKHKCKMNGVLSVIIDGVGVVGGVWKFRTTSYNSIVGILSSLALIKRLTGGPLAGIPLYLTISPKTGISPDGQAVMIYVVGLEYRGTPDQLQEIGYERALKLAQHSVRIEQIEDQARSMLRALPMPELDGDEADDVVDEFYPDQAQAAIAHDPDHAPAEQAGQQVKASTAKDGNGALAKPKGRGRRKTTPKAQDGQDAADEQPAEEQIAQAEAGGGDKVDWEPAGDPDQDQSPAPAEQDGPPDGDEDPAFF